MNHFLLQQDNELDAVTQPDAAAETQYEVDDYFNYEYRDAVIITSFLWVAAMVAPMGWMQVYNPYRVCYEYWNGSATVSVCEKNKQYVHGGVRHFLM